MLAFFFVKQKTAYEVRISDWSSDVCSSDLMGVGDTMPPVDRQPLGRAFQPLLGRDHVARREPILALSVPPQRHQLGRGSHRAHHMVEQIGRASCRDRVRQYVSISGVAVTLKKNKKKHNIQYKPLTPK